MTVRGRLIWTISTVLLVSFLLQEFFHYRVGREEALRDATALAAEVHGMMMATRRVYHQQFLGSGLPLNENTLGFLPAYAMSRIARDFPNWSDSGITFNNVSDRPRNPANMASPAEREVIGFFRNNREATSHQVSFTKADGSRYMLFAHPIWVEPYCLKCHGPRDAAPKAIQDAYDAGFDYAVGELRGITSITVPDQFLVARISDHTRDMRIAYAVSSILVMGLIVQIVRRFVDAPMVALHRGMQRLSAGDLGARIAPLDGEFGQIGHTLNTLAGALQADIARREAAEAALAEKSAYLDNILRSSSEQSIIAADLDFTIRYCNPATERIFAIAPGQVVGQNIHDIHRDNRVDDGRVQAGLARIRSGAEHGFEMRPTVNGEERIIECKAAGIWDARRELTGFVLISRDVTARRRADRLLAESEERYRRLLELAHDAILVADPESGQLVDANRMASRLLGRPIGEIIGMHHTGLYPPDRVDAGVRAFESVVAAGEGTIPALAVRHADGHDLQMEVRAAAVDVGGRRLVQGIFRDTTERLSTAEVLRRSRENLLTAQRIARLGNWEWPVGAEQVSWSEEMYRIFGLDPDGAPVTMESFLTSAHPDDREGLRGLFDFFLTAPSFGFNYEYRLLRADGSERVVQQLAEATRDDSGAAVHVIGTLQDITELKRVERRLEEALARISEQENHLRSILENAPVAIVCTDADGHLVSLNPRAEQLFGCRADRMLGKPLAAIVAPREADGSGGWLAGFVPGADPAVGMGRRVEMSGRHADGSPVNIELVMTEVKRHSAVAYCAFITDISERKRLIQTLQETLLVAESASRAKSEFLANMSHEIRSPLNAVIGMTDLVLNSELSGDQRANLEIVQQSSLTLLELINGILDLSKIDEGLFFLEKIPFDVVGQIEKTCQSLAIKAHQRDLELHCALSPQLPETLIGDPLRLSQILTNLVANAVKFTRFGEITIRVEPDAAAAPDGIRLRFSVADSGIGIAEEKQQLIFERFTQEDGSTTRRYGGTGLGLTISRELVHLMRGRIWVDSTPGQGSTFHFTAHFDTVGGQGTVSGDADGLCGGIQEAPLSGVTVLVADGNASGRGILVEVLGGFGAAVEQAVDVSEALAHLDRAAEAEQYFDIMLLDQSLLRRESPELARLSNHAGCRNKPIAALFTNQSLADLPGGRLLKGASALKKPVGRFRALNLVNRLLGRSVEQRFGVMEKLLVERRRTVPLNILLVEDMMTNQKVAVSILEQVGHRVTVASHGNEALSLLGRMPFDLILMDLQMPVLDGYETTRAIRSADSHDAINRDIPIVAVTARTMDGEEQRCIEAGMNGYLKKPYLGRELIAAIQPFAKRRRRVDERRTPLKGGDARPVVAVGVSPEALEQHKAEFLAEMPAHVATLGAALADQSVAQAMQEADRVRRKAGEVGAVRVKTQAMRLKGHAEMADWEEARKTFAALESELAKAVRLLSESGEES